MRAAVAFPGRGSYGPPSLGSLPAGHAWVRRADELRVAAGLQPITEVDGAGRFDPNSHLRPTNGWPLVFLCGLLDAERIADDHEVVVVVANSTGWYTALAASGALGFDDAFNLVQGMAAAAEQPLPSESMSPTSESCRRSSAWLASTPRARGRRPGQWRSPAR
jgi:[acyl-carrier-protein] S-malonyltransferase